MSYTWHYENGERYSEEGIPWPEIDKCCRFIFTTNPLGHKFVIRTRFGKHKDFLEVKSVRTRSVVFWPIISYSNMMMFYEFRIVIRINYKDMLEFYSAIHKSQLKTYLDRT